MSTHRAHIYCRVSMRQPKNGKHPAASVPVGCASNCSKHLDHEASGLAVVGSPQSAAWFGSDCTPAAAEASHSCLAA